MSRPIADGSSLAGTSIQEISAAIHTNRHCTIQITNHSDFDLSDPNHYCQSGYCHAPPQPIIEAYTRDACSFSKAAEAATGAVGVLTYRLGESHTRFALMFSVPYDFNLYSSWFALAFIDENLPANEALYKEMYYGKDADRPDFRRAKAKDGITLKVEKGDWKISATMSEAKKAIIHLEIIRKGAGQGQHFDQPGSYGQHHHHQHNPGWAVQ